MDIRLLQQLLNTEGFALKVDGVLGAKTTNALRSLSVDRQQQIELEASAPIDGKRKAGKLSALIASIATAERVPETYLWLVVQLEHDATIANFHAPIDSTGPYIGIAQFSQGTWADAMPGYPWKDALDPKIALIGAAKYYKINQIRLQKVSPSLPYTDKVAYLCHNQGAKGAAGLIAGTRTLAGDQSVHAREIAAELRSQYGLSSGSFS